MRGASDEISGKPPGWPAALHLLLFALLIAVPLLLVMGALLIRATELERERVESRIVQAVEAIVGELERDMDRHLSVLRTLATSSALAAEDWPAFHDQAKAGLAGRAYIVLLDAAGRQIVNTYLPYGQAPSITGDPQTLKRMRDGQRVVVSNLFVSLAVKEAVYNISVPIHRAGELRFVLSIGLTPNDLYQLLQAQKLQPDWTALVWDGNGMILARSRDHARIVGTAIGSHLRDRQPSMVFRTTNIDGLEVLAAVRASGMSDWRVGVYFTASVIDGHLRDSLLVWVGMILAAAATVAALALFFGRRLTKPLAEVIAAAGALGRRQAFDIRPSRLREANAVVAALQGAARELDRSSAALRDSEERLRTAAEAADFGPHEYDVAADRSFRSPQMRRLLGVGESPASFEDGLASVHPDDRGHVRLRKQQIISGPEERYELEYRIRRPDGDVRWVMDRGQVSRDGHGKASRIVGVLLDISRLKEAEARQRLLFDELNHRVKNTLAIVQALADQTLRANPDRTVFTREFGGRLASLARAHDLLTQESRRGAPLQEILATAMAPFINEGRSIRIQGAAVTVPASATITLSLMLHELASNAAKYGALSVAEGRIRIEWTATSAGSFVVIDMEWVEENGPTVAPAPRQGFGSRLLAASAAQINGELTVDHAPVGLRCRLCFRVPLPDADQAQPHEEQASKSSAGR